MQLGSPLGLPSPRGLLGCMRSVKQQVVDKFGWLHAVRFLFGNSFGLNDEEW
jgi:hypothetical protein